MHDNIKRLITIAKALGDLRNEMVFVGGTVTSLYADDMAAPDIRATNDVDCITELATYGSYANLENRLREIGFKNDIESNVICRWRYKGEIVDVMPDDENILGFSNRWYKQGFENKISHAVTPDLDIWIFPVLYFLVAKIEALVSRGGIDWRGSSDFEDIVFVLNNKKGILDIFEKENNNDLKCFLSEWAKGVLKRSNIREEIESVLAYEDYDRKNYVIKIFEGFM